MSSSSIEIHRHSSSKPWTYADLERRQDELRASVLSGSPGRLIFSEVAPVITLGFRRTQEDLLFTREEYSRRGIELLEVSRGGRATYHGPGQWVIFPVDSLERLTGDRRGVRKIVDALLEATRDACRSRFPDAEIREGKEAGLWTNSGAGGAKIAALGIRVVDGVVQHGLSVNVFSTSESFVGIRPCGLDAGVAFLARGDASTHEEEFIEWRARLEAALLLRFPSFSG